MIKEENQVGVLWCCSDCSYSNRRKANLARHIEAKHIENEGVHCQFCGNFNPNNNSLQSHISRNHRSQYSVIDK